MTIDPSAIRERLVKHVDCLASLIGIRTLHHPTAIEAAIGYITQQWSGMGYDVRQQTYEAVDGFGTNLIVETRGAKRPEQIILLGAHYDSTPFTPGADDNASAVAVMLEVARLLKEHVPRRTIRYVAFACEEAPYFNLGAMGSQHHAREARQAHERILGMLCLEMVGYFRDDPNSQKIPATIPRIFHPLFPTVGNFLAAVGNLNSWSLNWKFRRGFKRGSQLPLWSLNLPERVHEIRRSDNSSFWDQGYPALMLTDTSFLRNPNYHQMSDTPETLDYDRMTQVALGVAAAVKRLVG
ncbi:M28 family metallopeptidase [Blastopirellula sp. JC732]|uniref:M28 family metallopeptidase n=1 Tax=Blastopirellula sediminis TaxID=2894196 RepID=A0A9X1MN96_9BACT|nr:M28 family metallopeptidase [Blastopirellula sediminis]MCC9606906.1 M28 family metallopeptidase [Blastopirellula sediminis]MCC9629799.1 M28 family metallopeptidase [Blastopirellula sediminis]